MWISVGFKKTCRSQLTELGTFGKLQTFQKLLVNGGGAEFSANGKKIKKAGKSRLSVVFNKGVIRYNII